LRHEDLMIETPLIFLKKSKFYAGFLFLIFSRTFSREIVSRPHFLLSSSVLILGLSQNMDERIVLWVLQMIKKGWFWETTSNESNKTCTRQIWTWKKYFIIVRFKPQTSWNSFSSLSIIRFEVQTLKCNLKCNRGIFFDEKSEFWRFFVRILRSRSNLRFYRKNSRMIVLERWWDKSKSVRKWKMGSCQCGRSKEDKGLFQNFFQENFYIL